MLCCRTLVMVVTVGRPLWNTISISSRSVPKVVSRSIRGPYTMVVLCLNPPVMVAQVTTWVSKDKLDWYPSSKL